MTTNVDANAVSHVCLCDIVLPSSMDCDSDSSSDFNGLLMAAARQGDTLSLETHLSTVADASIFLNRVYNEESEQKCTLLTTACLHGREDIVRMLLCRFKPDLEILNTILFENHGENRQICSGVTALWTAAAIDNFTIVKLLVESGAQVNHTSDTKSTPLRCACYNGNIDMARYLIEHGANVHITKERNDTNLAVSACRKHLNIVAYLLDELDCDVNECDEDGRSALYEAVIFGSSEIVEFLLSRGSRNFPAKFDQMTPLMWAAEKRRTDLVDIFFQYCSLLEWIEAKELLGSAFACGEHGPYDLDQSLEHFQCAIEFRSIHNLPKNLSSTLVEVFDNRRECETIEQIEELKSNPDSIYTEALLVRQRLLGPTNSKYRYSLQFRGAVLADNAQYDRAIALWMYELTLRRQYAISIDPQDLRQFMSIFAETAHVTSTIPIETLLQLMMVISEELTGDTADFDYNLHTLLFLVTLASQLLVTEIFSDVTRKEFSRLLRTAIQRQYTTKDYKESLLHLCLQSSTSASDHFIDRICYFPSLMTAHVLLQCGADVNAIDAVRNTPLHALVSNTDECDEATLELLCNAGAHLDYANALQETPVDSASNSTTKQLLKAKMRLSLKCICARLIRKNGMAFREQIATSLIDFVEKH